jgi:tetratricopeptide (TPR) repeat protein
LSYVVALAILALCAGALLKTFGGGPYVVTAIALTLLIPGRIQGFYFRDLFIGRRLLDADRPEEAIPLLERFLESLERHPSRNKLLWLSWSFYTPSATAMTLNNLGAARLELGQIDEAKRCFTRALEEDSFYPIPHFNLAIAHEVDGDHEAAAAALETSTRLGFTRGTLDRVISKAQSLLARVES